MHKMPDNIGDGTLLTSTHQETETPLLSSQSEIKVITHITEMLSNLRQGDCVVLDLDDTILLPEANKYGVLPKLSEPQLPKLIQQHARK